RRRSSRSSSSGSGGGAGGLTVIVRLRTGCCGASQGRGSVATNRPRAAGGLSARRFRARQRGLGRSSSESLPAASRALQRTLLRGREQDQLARLLLVGEDRREVTIGEPACIRARPQRTVDLLVAVELGEIDRLGHLAPQALRALRGGLDQPLLRAVAERKEVPLLGASCPWTPVQR